MVLANPLYMSLSRIVYTLLLHEGHFIQRGYPKYTLDEAMSKTKALDRHMMLQPKTPDTSGDTTFETEVNKVFAITTYHPTQQSFWKIIHDNWELLGSPGTQSLLESQVFYGNRRLKNLREHLVRAALKPPKEALSHSAIKAKECGSPGKCNYCPKIDLSGLIKSRAVGREFRTRTSVNCRSIECSRCGMHFVAQTKRRLMDRMVGHFDSIRGEQMKYPVGNHFSCKNRHQGLEDVRLFVLEFCQTLPNDDSRGACEAIECKWQFRLPSNFPLGMNCTNRGRPISTTPVEIFDNP